MSMHDLAGIERLADVRRAGVTALKIEGRMKNADWVRDAVRLYRRALSCENAVALKEEVQRLTSYAGRQVTADYWDGRRDNLTGQAGRPRALDDPASLPCKDVSEAWRIPKTVVRRPHKAASIEQLFAWLATQSLHGCHLGQCRTNDPPFLMVPRAVNALVGRVSKFIQRSQKYREELSRVELPLDAQELLRRSVRCPSNRTALGSPSDRVRLEKDQLAAFVDQFRPDAVIVEGLAADDVRPARALCRRLPMIVALPPVFFESDIDSIKPLLRECVRLGLVVEVNSWGGWRLASEAGARMEAGPSLAVLNSLAARALGKRGIESVTLSLEADRRQLEDVSAHCPLPCSLVVFGRPPLMISRVELPETYCDGVWTDRRGTRITARRESGMWVVRPVEPFDLRDLQNDRIQVRHLVVDLVASPHPLRDWQRVPSRGKSAFRFNYDRELA
jgi:collagenase-like PrtC family protease